jgi:hypothetical protein
MIEFEYRENHLTVLPTEVHHPATPDLVKCRVVKSNTPLLSGGFIKYKAVISVLLLKVSNIVLNQPT